MKNMETNALEVEEGGAVEVHAVLPVLRRRLAQTVAALLVYRAADPAEPRETKLMD